MTEKNLMLNKFTVNSVEENNNTFLRPLYLFVIFPCLHVS